MNKDRKKIEDYLEQKDIKIQKGTDSITFSMGTEAGITTMVMYSTFPHMNVYFFDIREVQVPDMTEGDNPVVPIQFNYCAKGRVELLLDDNTYFYLKEGEFCLSGQSSRGGSHFPLKKYQGITIYFQPEFFTENKHIQEMFHLDFGNIEKLYFSRKNTYVSEAGREMKSLLERMWELKEQDSGFHMKMCCLELLNILLNEKNIIPEKTVTIYTGVQVEIAKQAEAILTADLKEHIPIKNVADKFGISETSLKNYFKGVYCKNISDYMRDLRIEEAEKMLKETSLPISEISARVGYTKQGKFSEVFRKKNGVNPLEYRRMHKINNLREEKNGKRNL